ncbi:hypothetical protein M404DRAFT_1003995 [Pisolithus tinctorius Marx 270]|uniref:Uncharacterized protein n=1 Tax=Pisolithus tinctorius Marx 270 TaxID=870435 RepID=A0A0C3JS31_PISTI|nr:hypothetical protein M404DRAFT_1003995 [Pisolithus tinctorius Marx 270]
MLLDCTPELLPSGYFHTAIHSTYVLAWTSAISRHFRYRSTLQRLYNLVPPSR